MHLSWVLWSGLLLLILLALFVYKQLGRKSSKHTLRATEHHQQDEVASHPESICGGLPSSPRSASANTINNQSTELTPEAPPDPPHLSHHAAPRATRQSPAASAPCTTDRASHASLQQPPVVTPQHPSTLAPSRPLSSRASANGQGACTPNTEKHERVEQVAPVCRCDRPQDPVPLGFHVQPPRHESASLQRENAPRIPPLAPQRKRRGSTLCAKGAQDIAELRDLFNVQQPYVSKPRDSTQAQVPRHVSTNASIGASGEHVERQDDRRRHSFNEPRAPCVTSVPEQVERGDPVWVHKETNRNRKRLGTSKVIAKQKRDRESTKKLRETLKRSFVDGLRSGAECAASPVHLRRVDSASKKGAAHRPSGSRHNADAARERCSKAVGDVKENTALVRSNASGDVGKKDSVTHPLQAERADVEQTQTGAVATVKLCSGSQESRPKRFKAEHKERESNAVIKKEEQLVSFAYSREKSLRVHHGCKEEAKLPASSIKAEAKTHCAEAAQAVKEERENAHASPSGGKSLFNALCYKRIGGKAVKEENKLPSPLPSPLPRKSCQARPAVDEAGGEERNRPTTKIAASAHANAAALTLNANGKRPLDESTESDDDIDEYIVVDWPYIERNQTMLRPAADVVRDLQMDTASQRRLEEALEELRHTCELLQLSSTAGDLAQRVFAACVQRRVMDVRVFLERTAELPLYKAACAMLGVYASAEKLDMGEVCSAFGSRDKTKATKLLLVVKERCQLQHLTQYTRAQDRQNRKGADVTEMLARLCDRGELSKREREAAQCALRVVRDESFRNDRRIRTLVAVAMFIALRHCRRDCDEVLRMVARLSGSERETIKSRAAQVTQYAREHGRRLVPNEACLSEIRT